MCLCPVQMCMEWELGNPGSAGGCFSRGWPPSFHTRVPGPGSSPWEAGCLLVPSGDFTQTHTMSLTAPPSHTLTLAFAFIKTLPFSVPFPIFFPQKYTHKKEKKKKKHLLWNDLETQSGPAFLGAQVLGENVDTSVGLDYLVFCYCCCCFLIHSIFRMKAKHVRMQRSPWVPCRRALPQQEVCASLHAGRETISNVHPRLLSSIHQHSHSHPRTFVPHTA